METKQPSLQQRRKRKFLLVAPLLVLPFITILFVVLGGGRIDRAQAQHSIGSRGLNVTLPEARFKKGKEAGKLELYEAASRDSLRMKESRKADPYYQSPLAPPLETLLQQSAATYHQEALMKKGTGISSASARPGYSQTSEAQVMQKLSLLEQQLKKPAATTASYPPTAYALPQTQDLEKGPAVERLEQMMARMQTAQQPDPELQQLDGMLDKILAIQHPAAITDSSRPPVAAPIPVVYGVSAPAQEEPNGFYGLDEEEGKAFAQTGAVTAVIHETQTLVSGATVKMHLTQSIQVNGIELPAGQLVYGTASLNNERLKIAINAIRSGDRLLPVSLEVYDLDGMPGIYVPGSISRESAQVSAGEIIGSAGVTTSVDPSLGAQAAGAGIQTVKTLLSKKVRLVQVTLKANYKILLKDMKRV